MSYSHFRETIRHIRQLPRVFWLVIVATILNQTGNMAFIFLVLYLFKHLGFSLKAASFAFAIFSASMVLTGLLTGSLVDKLGAACVLSLSLFVNGLILLIFPAITPYALILIFCVMWGFTFGLYRPASQTFVSYLSKPGMNKITFSVYRLASNLGMSIGPALGGYLAMHSFTHIFIFNGLANIFASLILTFGFMRTHWFSYRPTLKATYELSIKWLKRDKTLRLFVLSMIFVSMVFFQHESTLAVFLNHTLHLPLSFYGLLFTLNTLMIVFLELPLNVATLNWPYRINFILGSLFISAGFAGLLFATQHLHIIVLTIVWTIGEMILYPSATSFISEIATEENRGSYISLFNTSSNVGLMLGPLLGGFIMEHFGPSWLWINCGIWGIIAMIIFYYLPLKVK